MIEIALETRPATSSPSPKKASRTAGFDLTNGAPPETVEAIIEDFVDQIGPLGTVLADRVAQDLGYRAGALMEPGILDKFVAALADEISVAERQAFLDKYGP